MFEKALDTASKSPYATWSGVDSWLLVGMGNGARVAATISSKAKAPVAGLAVISYPLHEATPPAGKGAGFPDSTTQLVKSTAPLLMLHAQHDGRCSAASLRTFCRQQRPQRPGSCFGVIPGVNEIMNGSDEKILCARTIVRAPCWPVACMHASRTGLSQLAGCCFHSCQCKSVVHRVDRAHCNRGWLQQLHEWRGFAAASDVSTCSACRLYCTCQQACGRKALVNSVWTSELQTACTHLAAWRPAVA